MVIAGFNLAAVDYRRNRRTLLLLGTASIVLVLVLAAQLVLWSAQRRENQAVESHLAGMEAQFRQHQSQMQGLRTQLPAETVKQYEAKVVTYNQFLEASVFSWIGLLTELERSVPPGVTVATIQPDLSTGKVSLRGEARSFEDITKLLRGLEERTAFRDVFLLHQGTHKATGGAPDTLDFSVSLIYKGRSQ
jgi:Tfp pilus assembly protein PilN